MNKKRFAFLAVLLALSAGIAFAVIVPGVSVSFAHRSNLIGIVTVSNKDNIGHTVKILVTFKEGETATETIALTAGDSKKFEYRVHDHRDGKYIPYKGRGNIVSVDIIEGI
jgi:hypothetical protein